MDYGFSKNIDLSYEKAIERVTEELKKEGFGVLTTIDVKDTLKKKIDVEFKRYVILGACNPSLAHRALSADEQIGLLLPCNVVVKENGAGSTVSVFDPSVMVQIAGSPAIAALAAEVREKLERVFNSL
jgi:uncharacterized protein (DUF302 family)